MLQIDATFSIRRTVPHDGFVEYDSYSAPIITLERILELYVLGLSL